MALQINDSFQINSAVPIDTRIMLTKNEMLNVDENLMPDVYFAICTDGKFYLYNKTNSKDPATGKFRVLEGSGSAKIDKWVSKESYNTDDLVIYNNTIYQCITSNNDAVFDKTKWTCLSGETTFTKVDKTTIDLATDLATGIYILNGEIEGVAFTNEVSSVLVDGDVYTIVTLSGKVYAFDVVKNTKVEDKFATETKVDDKIYDSLYEVVPEHYSKAESTDLNALEIVDDSSTPSATQIKLSDVTPLKAGDTWTPIIGEYALLIPEGEQEIYLKASNYIIEDSLLDLSEFDKVTP